RPGRGIRGYVLEREPRGDGNLHPGLAEHALRAGIVHSQAVAVTLPRDDRAVLVDQVSASVRRDFVPAGPVAVPRTAIHVRVPGTAVWRVPDEARGPVLSAGALQGELDGNRVIADI